jgi:hypothetical protein
MVSNRANWNLPRFLQRLTQKKAAEDRRLEVV